MIESGKYQEAQEVQAEYRKRLVQEWQIAEGARILEVGCGQGDMTALLAQAVGSFGVVLAVDIASPNYGSPLTLGEATTILKRSEIGPQIDFRFEFDVLEPLNSFANNSFDCVVMAHCSWYFATADQLLLTLKKVRPWTKILCFAEWDIVPKSTEQVPHLLAVIIQGQVEAFKTNSSANIRTPLTKSRLKQLLQESGWSVIRESNMDTRNLQDADWEVDMCLRESLEEVRRLNLPDKFVSSVESQVEILRERAKPKGNPSLNSYSLVAN